MRERSLLACCTAELVGTWLLVFLGCGAVHSAVLTLGLAGLWQVGSVWGVAIMGASYACGPVSGAHINPAITVGFAVWGKFPWPRVAPYIAAQTIGAFIAAAMLYTLFSQIIDHRERHYGVTRGQPGSEITAMCYGEYYPNPGTVLNLEKLTLPPTFRDSDRLVTHGIAMLAEVIGTAILALVVCAVTDDRSPSGPRYLAPLFIGLTVAALISVIAPLTQACLNPARDVGPRLFAYLAGWGEIALPGPRGHYWMAVYIAAPIMGGILGAGLYHRVLRTPE
jgi:glycerol uptake facilitator protein